MQIWRWCVAVGLVAALLGATSFSPTQPFNAVSHQFLTSLASSGAFSAAQPACADISNAGTSCTVNTGTSGATIPFNNGNNTLSGNNTYSGISSFTGSILGTGRTVTGTTDTLAATDCGTVITYTSGSAITLTTLANIVSGSNICAIGAYQHGAGQITVSDGASATHVSQGSCTKSSGQYAILQLAVLGAAGVSEYNIAGQCS